MPSTQAFDSPDLPRAGGLRAVALALTIAAAPTLSSPASAAPNGAGNVDTARLAAADSEPQNWFTGGRDKDGTYYSPLAKIDAKNVGQLGFAWSYDLGDPMRGQEATPTVIDGVMYTSGTWGYVYAVDAASGKEIWRYDPKADYFMGRNPCCDLVNRGVAVWKGKVYVASVDGRLHALDAATGRKLWEADTIIDRKLPYSSTGAPQIAGGVVVIGNSGADMGHGAVRGYVSAYDLDSGALKWRFFTVPPAAGQPYENPELAAADKTWDPHRKPEFKGGATVWDGFAYDAKLNLVYFGTANAAPYDLRQLGSEKLDSLYATCIIALDAATGRMAWYYQETPHDSWDYDAVQKLILADIMIDGAPRPVIMQASKNAFFYVLDRKTGKLLSAKNFAYLNWATHVDMKTGRPVITKAADWYDTAKNIYPSWFGAHTWNPMSYSAQTRLVYIPVIDVPTIWVDLLHNGSRVKYIEGFFTVQGIIPDDTYDPDDATRLFGPVPGTKAIKAMRHVKPVRELIRAWDPVAQKAVWEHETSSGIRGYDGGVMSTGGQPGVSRPRQRRAVGVCRRYRQGTEGHQDRQPHHGGADDLRDQRRAVCRGAGRLRRHRDHRRAHPAEQRRAQIPKHQPHHRLQTGRRRGADAAAARRNRRCSRRRSRPPPKRRSTPERSSSSSSACAVTSWVRAARRTCADSTMACMWRSRTSS